MTQETVLITGASSGIGRDLAACFAADGSRTVQNDSYALANGTYKTFNNGVNVSATFKF